ncbi:ankyrin repeat domain-containing protein [Thiotrichales bacterium 19S9-12]|nr:ankyrin repeat domain-containing protein [Thiotrichales bacterium 19S9-11]MCF6811842.1 ankyrin repeat domain-containing protein [Thiotrichales bacterium 19S9-12]
MNIATQKIKFFDFGRGPIKSVIEQFESREENYYSACSKTYEEMSHITIETLSIEDIQIFHRKIIEGVKDTNYRNQQHTANVFYLNSINFPISHFSTNPSSLEKMMSIYSKYGRYDSIKKLYIRKKLSKEEMINYIDNLLGRIKANYQSLRINSQIEYEQSLKKIIYEFIQELEILHPFKDANCRFFCINLYNILRKNSGLKEVILADPNLFDYLPYDNFIDIPNTHFEIDDKEWSEKELKENNLKAIQCYNKLTFSGLFLLFVTISEASSELISDYIDFIYDQPNLKNILIPHAHEGIFTGPAFAFYRQNQNSLEKYIIKLLSPKLKGLSKEDRLDIFCNPRFDGNSFMHLLTQPNNNNKMLFELILQELNECDLSVKNKDNLTVAQYAILHENYSILSIIIKYKSIHFLDDISKAFFAAYSGNIEILQISLPNIVDKIPTNYTSLLYIAAQYGHANVIEYIIDKFPEELSNINLESNENSSNTPLHIAVEENHIDVIRSLLNKKADPNITNSFDNTSFHLAIIKNNVAAFQLMLECSHYEINFSSEIGEQTSLLKLAEKPENSSFLKLIQEHQAKTTQSFNYIWPDKRFSDIEKQVEEQLQP